MLPKVATYDLAIGTKNLKISWDNPFNSTHDNVRNIGVLN
jgi:hypothetical protein